MTGNVLPRLAGTMEDSFQRHLEALNAVYEQVISENAELRKQLGNPLLNLSQSGSGPPLPPVATLATVSTLNLQQENSPQLPGALIESENLQPNLFDGTAAKAFEKEGEELEDIHNGVESHPITSLPESPSPPECSPPPLTDSKSNHAKPSQRRSSFIRQSLMTVNSGEETEDDATFLLLLDVVPAVVILISAVVAGFSADIAPDHTVWVVLEMLFTLFFIGEIVVKMKVFGLKEYMWGADWYWSWFDILCVILAIVDLSLNLSAAAEGTQSDTGALSSLKMLKLARLGRIVRLLKFKIFQELKLMIQGVFTGLRVLFWAVVLLVGMMYLLGVVTRTVFGSDHAEFGSATWKAIKKAKAARALSQYIVQLLVQLSGYKMLSCARAAVCFAAVDCQSRSLLLCSPASAASQMDV